MGIFKTGIFGGKDSGFAMQNPRRHWVALTAAAALAMNISAGSAFAQEAETGVPEASPAPVEQPAQAPAPVAEPEAAVPAPPPSETPAVPAPEEQPATPEVEAPAQPAQSPEETSPQPAQEETPAPGEDVVSENPAEGTAPQAIDDAPPAIILDDGTADPASVINEEGGAEESNSTLPHDLSPWGMFMAADWVVKAVMIGLAFASVVTWTVWVAKSLEIAGAKGRLAGVLRTISRSRRLEDAAGPLRRRGGPGALLVRAAEEEVRLSADALDHAGADGLKDRVSARLQRIQAQAGRRLGRGTGLLATIGSTAPFVGLFGTVWGIMNSFIGISEAQTTNLAVVAPGIAEALLATAMGLLAAIPAVVFYNMFARSITGYRQMLADAGAGVELLVSRDLDYRLVPGGLEAQAAAAAPIAPPSRKG